MRKLYIDVPDVNNINSCTFAATLLKLFALIDHFNAKLLMFDNNSLKVTASSL